MPNKEKEVNSTITSQPTEASKSNILPGKKNITVLAPKMPSIDDIPLKHNPIYNGNEEKTILETDLAVTSAEKSQTNVTLATAKEN